MCELWLFKVTCETDTNCFVLLCQLILSISCQFYMFLKIHLHDNPALMNHFANVDHQLQIHPNNWVQTNEYFSWEYRSSTPFLDSSSLISFCLEGLANQKAASQLSKASNLVSSFHPPNLICATLTPPKLFKSPPNLMLSPHSIATYPSPLNPFAQGLTSPTPTHSLLQSVAHLAHHYVLQAPSVHSKIQR